MTPICCQIGRICSELYVLCATHDHKYSDSVLVDILLHELRIESELAFLANIQDSSFDLEVASKLLQSYLSIGACTVESALLILGEIPKR